MQLLHSTSTHSFTSLLADLQTIAAGRPPVLHLDRALSPIRRDRGWFVELTY